MMPASGNERDEAPPTGPGGGSPRPRLRVALRASAVVAVLAGVLLLMDLLGGPQLPQPARPLLPLVLAAAVCLALVLGVGAYGSPRRPHRP